MSEIIHGRSSGLPNTVCIVELREWQWDTEKGRYDVDMVQMAIASTYDKAIEYIKQGALKPPTPNIYWWYVFEDEIDNFDVCYCMKGRTMVDKEGNPIDCTPDPPEGNPNPGSVTNQHQVPA